MTAAARRVRLVAASSSRWHSAVATLVNTRSARPDLLAHFCSCEVVGPQRVPGAVVVFNPFLVADGSDRCPGTA